VLDWAVDRALTRLGRNQVPVATAAVDAPMVIALGTLANQRGQVVLSSTVAMTFFAPPAAPFIEQDVPELLERVGFRSGAVNTGVALDLDAHAALVPAAVAEMLAYMRMQKRTRADLLSEPLSAAARRIDTWGRAFDALAGGLAPGQAGPLRRRVAEHADQADELVQTLSARADPMVRVLLVLLPKGGGLAKADPVAFGVAAVAWSTRAAPSAVSSHGRFCGRPVDHLLGKSRRRRSPDRTPPAGYPGRSMQINLGRGVSE
jgi:hypothetical protein